MLNSNNMQLELKYHDETPDHDYVPWVIINDKHIEVIF